MRIGITFFVADGPSSIWSNGGAQNCVFLWQLLQRIPGVEKVYAINAGYNRPADPALLLDRAGIELVRFDQVKDEIDLLIEAWGEIEQGHEQHIHARGGKVVGYRFGNSYVIDTERVIHNQPSGSIMNGSRLDEIWTNEQHVRTCKQYWEVMYRCPVKVLPHIWSPFFVDIAREEMGGRDAFRYQPGSHPKRICILEPNINILKTCQIPMLVCELAYRRRPDLIGDIYVCGAVQLKEHATFKAWAKSLDIVRSGRCSFEHRYNTPWFLSRFGDVVVSHQWENALNYLYYEVLEAGYPLVHSSPMLGSAGYRYEPFDIEHGAQQLERAVTMHDSHADLASAERLLTKCSIDTDATISAYAEAISDVMAERRAA